MGTSNSGDFEVSKVRSALNILQEKTAEAFTQLDVDYFIESCFKYALKNPKSNMALLVMRVILDHGLGLNPVVVKVHDKKTTHPTPNEAKNGRSTKQPDSASKRRPRARADKTVKTSPKKNRGVD